jgi:PAS domain S-box-containing protein
MTPAAAEALLPYLVSVAVSAAVGVVCWRRRARPGASAYAVVALSQAATTLGLVLETAAPGLAGKIFWDNVQFLTMAPLPGALLVFAWRLRARRPERPIRAAVLLTAPAAAFAALAFTDPLHHLVRETPRLVPGHPFSALLYGFAPGMLAWCAYVLVVWVTACVLLTAPWIYTDPLYRAQARLVQLGVIAPVLGGALTLTVLRDSPLRDTTPVTFALGNLLVAWALLRRRLFDVVPVARHLVVQSLGDAVWVLDAEGCLVDLNPAARRASGGADDLVGRMAAEVLPFSVPPPGAPVEVEIGAAPAPRYAEVTVHPLLGPRGEVGGEVVVARDVTDRRRAEDALRAAHGELEARVRRRTAELEAANAALREGEERFRTMVESLSEAIVRTDADGVVLYASPRIEEITGYAPAEMVGRRAGTILLSGVELRAADDRLEARRRGESGRWEVPITRKDGSTGWFEVIGTALCDASGKVAGGLDAVTDVTARHQAEEALRRSEEQLRHAQKMEAVGRLAGGIAHDFNNLLMAIGGHAQLLLRRADDDDPRRASLEEIRRATDRAAALTRQLLAFSRRQVLAPRVMELGQAVLEMERMLERLLGPGVELALHLDPGTPRVLADPSQVEQVVMNLVVNAHHAMPGGGTIRVSTGTAVLGEGDVRRHPFLRPGRYAELTVSDSGVGMDEATLERIFEPFFTTREEGKGTGLGLSTVYGIVKQSGGYVLAESAPGAGSTFRVYLPPVEAPAAAPARPAPGPAPRGWETVLLVDDEDAVRGVVREALRLSGYEVLEARGGAQAVELAAAHPSAIHLLLTDVGMPGLDGPGTARRVLELHPEARVLFMSGHPRVDGDPDPGAALLQKPLSPDALARRVREALDAAPAGALP